MFLPPCAEYKIRFDDLLPEHINTIYLQSLSLLSNEDIIEANRLLHFLLFVYNFKILLRAGVPFTQIEKQLQNEYELIEADFRNNIMPLAERIENVLETACRNHRRTSSDALDQYQDLKNVIKTARSSYLIRLDEQRRQCTQSIFIEFNKLWNSGVTPSASARMPEDDRPRDLR